MRAYDKEFEARVRSRSRLYSGQLALHDALMRRATTELVDRAVSIALDAFNSVNPCTSASPPSIDPYESGLSPLAPPVSNSISDSAERLLTPEVIDDTLAWPAAQVISELSQAARVRLPDLRWQQLTGEKVVSYTTGEAGSIVDAFQSGPVTEDYVHLPIGMTSSLVRAEQHPLAGFSCGGAHDMASASLDVREPTDDCAITDDELGTCIGMCDTGHCVSGCRCSMKLKRKRAIVHAPAADLPHGTFKRPPLFQKGDAVEFASPERRIQVRTFGTIDSVHHMGAQPYYTVTSAKGTIYSFSEDCLRSRGTTDPNFALRGSELVTIGDLTTTDTVYSRWTRLRKFTRTLTMDMLMPQLAKTTLSRQLLTQLRISRLRRQRC